MKYVLEYTLYNGYDDKYDGTIQTVKNDNLEELLETLHGLLVKYHTDNAMNGWRLYNAETKTLLLRGLDTKLELYSGWEWE